MLNLLKGSLGINGKKSSTPRKSGEDCTNGKECVSGKYSNSKYLKKPNEECSSKEECTSNKCINGKCLADDGWQQSQNKILSNVKYSEPKSTSPEILAKIRNTKREEPKNTGENHPTTLYIPFGHGGENVGEKHIVPKGCILVVKSHSGDTRFVVDYIENVKAILDLKNKEVVFDPVSHKKELYSLLPSNIQRGINNITASNSSAVYREGDTFNNFKYQLVNKFPGSIGISGIFSLENSSTDTNFKKIDWYRHTNINNDTKVFVKDASNNYIYSPDIIKLDIPSFFSESNVYPYYYTSQHIQDILDVILAYINLHRDGYIDAGLSEIKLAQMLGKVYMNIKKGYTYVEGNSQMLYGIATPINIILMYGIKGCYNSIIECLRDMTLDRLFNIIIFMTNTTQAELFKDVEDGIIKPGIFYNLVCRATNNTLYILDTKYIENSDHTIWVKNQKGEIKNRISEAVLQRKNQAKQMFNDKAKKENEGPKVLTNNYKKYRNERTKKYKKVNGKWVENVNVGGRRLTRKRK